MISHFDSEFSYDFTESVSAETFEIGRIEILAEILFWLFTREKEVDGIKGEVKLLISGKTALVSKK